MFGTTNINDMMILHLSLSLGTALSTLAVLNTSPGEKNQLLLAKVCLEQHVSCRADPAFQRPAFCWESWSVLSGAPHHVWVILSKSSHGTRKQSIEPSKFESACRYISLHRVPSVPGREILLQILTIKNKCRQKILTNDSTLALQEYRSWGFFVFARLCSTKLAAGSCGRMPTSFSELAVRGNT